MSVGSMCRERRYVWGGYFSTMQKLEYSKWRQMLVPVHTHNPYVSSRHTRSIDIPLDASLYVAPCLASLAVGHSEIK